MYRVTIEHSQKIYSLANDQTASWFNLLVVLYSSEITRTNDKFSMLWLVFLFLDAGRNRDWEAPMVYKAQLRERHKWTQRKVIFLFLANEINLEKDENTSLFWLSSNFFCLLSIFSCTCVIRDRNKSKRSLFCYCLLT